ncbi:MAG: response regulator [Chloroflexi bacterium]|nr:response regulator [Chloroflexota bacterium]
MTSLLQGKRIFVIEDKEDNIFVIMSLLRKYGATVEIDWWAKGEPHKLESAMPIDLIILDLMLPRGRTGFEVYSEIRSNPTLSKVPIVAVSAMDPSLALPKTQEQGFSGFISKPIDFELFPQQVAILIAGEEVWYT